MNIINKRNIVLSAVLGATLIGTGCSRIRNIEPDALDPEPIPVDAAMARRDWPESRAMYNTTGIRSTPSLYTWQSDSLYGQDYTSALTELPLFLANVIVMPYQIFAEPVWQEKEYRGSTTPPTYSAMPPLPPSNENALEVPPAPENVDERAVPMDSPTTNPTNGG